MPDDRTPPPDADLTPGTSLADLPAYITYPMLRDAFGLSKTTFYRWRAVPVSRRDLTPDELRAIEPDISLAEARRRRKPVFFRTADIVGRLAIWLDSNRARHDIDRTDLPFAVVHIWTIDSPSVSHTPAARRHRLESWRTWITEHALERGRCVSRKANDIWWEARWVDDGLPIYGYYRRRIHNDRREAMLLRQPVMVLDAPFHPVPPDDWDSLKTRNRPPVLDDEEE